MPHASRRFGRRHMLLLGGGATASVAAAELTGAFAVDAGEAPGPPEEAHSGGDGRRARIDVHHHFTAPSWVTWAEKKGLVTRERLPWWTKWDLTSTLELMDDAGIATSVVSPAMPVRGFRDSAQLRDSVNVVFDAVEELKTAHPGRFAFFAPVFPDDLKTSRWSLARGLDTFGAVGVQTKACSDGVYLGDRSHDALLAELNERSAVISTHPLELPGTDPSRPAVPGIPSFLCDFPLDTTRAAVNLILNGTLDRYPDLSFILPHGGGFLPYIATRVERFAGFLTPPVEPARVRDYLHRFYYDTAGPLAPSSTPTLLSVTNPSRILFGSDWPATPAKTITEQASPALDTDPALTPRHRRAINRDNALRLLPSLRGTSSPRP
ncbi:amidohydrolase family protein [Streptomyces sp. NPDC051018]|uniref:amidohydrolase family protein n=1 Tax=Streptomyces sp. NPDC051018 TaxID=3365639 RepID=UPI003797F44A